MLTGHDTHLPDQGAEPSQDLGSQTGATAPFHVLALSGGGFRGLYTATVLKHLEEQLGTPLAKRFGACPYFCGRGVLKVVIPGPQ